MLHLETRYAGPVWLQHFMIWLFLCPSILLCIPSHVLPKSTKLWIEDYTAILYVGILTAVSYFITILFLFCLEKIMIRYHENQKKAQMAKMLQNIDFNERAVLREFWLQRKSMIPLPISEPSVKHLLDAGILEPAYPSADFFHKTHPGDKQIRPLIISLQARPFISFKVIGLNPTTLTAEQMEWIKNTRPRFAYRGFR